MVAADDFLTDVLLNGVSQEIDYIGLETFSDLFTINSGFIAGTNTISFVVDNGGVSDSPTGVRVEFSDATADEIEEVSDVPEPSSVALLGFGTILLFSRRFRKAK